MCERMTLEEWASFGALCGPFDDLPDDVERKLLQLRPVDESAPIPED